jgi:dTDP-glucose pyrophosphorylase
MAGEGSRFKKAGINQEKYELIVRNKSMFEYAMESISNFYNHEFIFVTRSSHNSRSFIQEKCELLGINKYSIVELTEPTSGQATTALKAKPHVERHESIVIYNIDTYVEDNHLTPKSLDGDGCIPVFQTDGGSWSFVSVDKSDHATEVAEKRPISSLASLGLYYFDCWEWFESALDAAGESVESEYGERYIAPLYNWLIDNNLDVTVQRVPRTAIHILGTPDDVLEFDPQFADRYDLER